MSPAETVRRTPRFHQVPQVISTRAGDATVLLDRRRGSYHTLNEVGGRVWELVGGGANTSEIVQELLREYAVDHDRLERDVAATLQRMMEAGLIARDAPFQNLPSAKPSERPGELPQTPGDPIVPSILRCLLLLAWFKGLLRLRGFLGTCEWIRNRVEPVRATAEAESAAVMAVEHAVAMAGAFYPGRAQCLEQSLTLYYLLRRQGVAATYRQGVQPYPFKAHAWVEYRGEVINDVAEHALSFARLPDQLP